MANENISANYEIMQEISNNIANKNVSIDNILCAVNSIYNNVGTYWQGKSASGFSESCVVDASYFKDSVDEIYMGVNVLNTVIANYQSVDSSTIMGADNLSNYEASEYAYTPGSGAGGFKNIE